MVNIIGGRALVPSHLELSGDLVSVSEINKMNPQAILQCRPNSHPFPERTLVLDQSVKIGRSVARARPDVNNALFDCKVLSRNHAVLYYDGGKFYLQDTKSSNGTFVNNQRLSKGSELSEPREVCSGDIVQFGVDVMENSRKVTHGCIVATLKLYMPDGQEAKASQSITVGAMVNVTAQELYQLQTYLIEANHREQQIENKLALLQQLISSTQEASVHSWNAMIDEDRLLQRLETLEGQLATYAKNYPEEGIKEEMRRLLEEKGQFELNLKEKIRAVLQEKLDAVTKLTELKRCLNTTAEEFQHAKDVAEANDTKLKELFEKQATQSQEMNQVVEKLKEAEEKCKDSNERYEEEKRELEIQLREKMNTENTLLAKIESLKAENDFTKEQHNAIRSKYMNLKNGDTKIIEEDGKDIDSTIFESAAIQRTFESEKNFLQERLKVVQEELQQAEDNVTQLKNEASIADEAENNINEVKTSLQEELLDLKCQNVSSNKMVEHLKSQLLLVSQHLRDEQTNSDCEKIVLYEDLYDGDNTHTLIRNKKASKSNKDKEKEKEECDVNEDAVDNNEDINSTITDIDEKNSVNGTEIIKDVEDNSLSKISTLRDVIGQLNELLSKRETIKIDDEVERIREKLLEATTAAITASHKASKLRRQLAASEAVMGEKAKMLKYIHTEMMRLVDSSCEVQTHLTNLSLQLTQEQVKSTAAEELAQSLKDQLAAAEELAKKNIEVVESLTIKINELEDKLQTLQTPPSIISPPAPEPPPNQQECNEIKCDESNTKPTSESQDIENNSLEINVCGKCQGSLKDDEAQNDDQKLRLRLGELENELLKWQEEVETLQKREAALKCQLDSATSTICNTPTESPQSSPLHVPINHNNKSEEFYKETNTEVETLRETISKLQKQHEFLRQQLVASEENFSDLAMQNRTSLPTWVMVFVVLGIALGYDWLPNVF